MVPMIPKISVEFPPNYMQIVAAVGKPPDTAIYTYGDTIYDPSNMELDDYVVAHEIEHIVQQKEIGAAEWWEHWIERVEFRVWQELEGYRAQFRSYAKVHKDRNLQAWYARGLASDASGPMYGHMIGFQEAYQRIRS